jgi:transcriptional regulator with XRE-family HTH domain
VARRFRASIQGPRTQAKAIRSRLGLSQEAFAREFGLMVATVRDWEQQRRVPRGPSLSLLRIIDREPAAARRALSPAEDDGRGAANEGAAPPPGDRGRGAA